MFINHDGSTGTIKVKVIEEFFNTCDTKSYKQICLADPYGVPISKMECIG